ncbi:unnamed protein product, partial [Aureobasidium pullulans]
MSIMRSSIMRSSRTAVSQPLSSTTRIRSYANKQNMDANQGQSSPGTASNVGNPVSSSPESNKINQSRATDARTGSPDTASVQTPVSNPKGAATGQQGEDSSTQQAFKQDPNAPASEKRKNVEEKAQRPLDPADKAEAHPAVQKHLSSDHLSLKLIFIFDNIQNTGRAYGVRAHAIHPAKLKHHAVGVKDRCITAWHSQQAWPDVAPALQRLRDEGYEIVVHANGTTRLQLDLCRSSGLQFDALFSSQLLGRWSCLQRDASECVIVAAHAYDLRGAKAVGMKTVYVYRWTDDVKENQEVVKKENEAWLENMDDIDQVIGSL